MLRRQTAVIQKHYWTSARWMLEEQLGQMGGRRSLREIRLFWPLNAFCRRSAPGKLGCGIAGHKRKRLLSGAREQAAAVTRRADARISKLHAAYLSKISAEIANLPTPQAAACETVDDADLARAARRLAAKLTGGP